MICFGFGKNDWLKKVFLYKEFLNFQFLNLYLWNLIAQDSNFTNVAVKTHNNSFMQEKFNS